MIDILIVGGGPAGISAALTAWNRRRSVLLLTSDPQLNPLSRAPLVTNYPGLASVTGAQLMETMHRQLRQLEIPVIQSRVTQLAAYPGGFGCAAGSEAFEGRSLLLCVGQTPRPAAADEDKYLGRGVSYCATCDGGLYRGRRVAVLGQGEDAVEDANFLESIGCRVRYYGRGDRPAGLGAGIVYEQARHFRILGDGSRVTGLEADGTARELEGVFILRPSMAADSLLPGLVMREGHVAVDGAMATSVPGVFAAGDCVGKPYQIAKAVGDGNIAALSADRWLEHT